MLKACQLRMALSLPCVTSMVWALGVLTTAWPDTTLAPSGSATASVDSPDNMTVSSRDNIRPMRMR